MWGKFVYLFLTDVARTSVHDYEFYTKTEPGYSACMLQAYITAFSQNTNGLISVELIHSIHKEAMKFKTDCNPGQYKSNYNSFTISPYFTHGMVGAQIKPTYNLTSEGLKEFINYWVKQNNAPFHTFIFKNIYSLGADEYSFEPLDTKTMKLQTSNSDGAHEKAEIISVELAEKIMSNLWIQKKYQGVINPYTDIRQNQIQNFCSQKIQIIIEEFNKEIMQTQNPDKKIRIIAKHIQRIDQVHPYMDGNIRTCYILMNKLLKDHGLGLTLLMNPNRLDANSLEEIVQMIKQGQFHYKQVNQHKEGNITLNAEKEVDLALQTIICKPQSLFDIPKKLVDDFIECVIEGKPILQSSFTNNRYAFLSSASKDTTDLFNDLSKLINVCDKIHEQIIKALEGKNYNLVLRLACAKYNKDFIETVLNYHETFSFNPKEESSNKKNAFHWLDTNKMLNSDKETIREKMESLCPSNKPAQL